MDSDSHQKASGAAAATSFLARLAHTANGLVCRTSQQEAHDTTSRTPLLANRDPFEAPFYRRVLKMPNSAKETLLPYGRLHVTVEAAKHLLAQDLNGASDPYAEVYVNDKKVGTSEVRIMNLNPHWGFNIELEIFSPLSIVQIRVMDRDRLTVDDIVGFVEFCVSDLEPNSTVAGWFELRRKRHFHGTAFSRFRTHARSRDDNLAKRFSEKGSSASDRAARMTLDALEGAEAPTPGGKHTIRVAMKQPGCMRCSTALSIWRGRVPRLLPKDSDSDDDDRSRQAGQQDKAKRDNTTVMREMQEFWGPESKKEVAKHVLFGEEGRPNAGEVQLTLRWECASAPEAEWYAFCFPRPKFIVFPGVVLDLRELYTDFSEIKNMVLFMFWAGMSIPEYILRWQSPVLSAAVLVWWWLACWWPAYVAPTIFLWPVLLIQLLRTDSWQQAMLVHEMTAPLNQTGFASLARLGASRRMETWLTRLLGQMGMRVCDHDKLTELSAGVIRDGKPMVSFAELQKYLKAAEWLHNCDNERMCPKGHALDFRGSRHVDERCQLPNGCNFHSFGSAWAERSHYFCPTCSIHLCEPCVASMARPPAWTRMPAELVPHFLEILLVKIEEPLHRLKKVLEVFVSLAQVPFQPGDEGDLSNQRVSTALCAMSASTWLLCVVLHGHLEGILASFFRVLLILGGTLCFVVELRVYGRFQTYLRASSDFEECQRRRQAGPLQSRWAFFAPDGSQHRHGSEHRRSAGAAPHSGTEQGRQDLEQGHETATAPVAGS